MNGLITIPSNYSVRETIDRVVSLIQKNGLTVFARMDHAENAKKVGMQLRPTELILYGNPRVGTILMLEQQSIGIDLPIKALAWEDENGKVWLTYNDTNWISERHGLTEKSGSTVRAIEAGLEYVAIGATKK